MTYTELQSPIYGTIDGFPVIVIGMRDDYWVYIGEDGKVDAARYDRLIVDVRFKDGEWLDVSPGFETQDE